MDERVNKMTWRESLDWPEQATFDDLSDEQKQRAFAAALEGENPLRGFIKYDGRVIHIMDELKKLFECEVQDHDR